MAVISPSGLVLSALLFMIFPSTATFAEPWLGNRFAQNCAGCHAPGRKNVEPMDRRCTLSCQGCHVNPNGGGMRSFYGQWTQDKWLRSFRTPVEKSTYSFVPVSKQPYGRRKYSDRIAKKSPRIIRDGYPITKSSKVIVDENVYDRRDGLELQTVENHAEFLYQIPQEDPYRQFDVSRVDGGADLRWIWRSLGSESNSNDAVPDTARKWQSFLMSMDFGVRIRPIHRYLHLVYEGRIFGNPSEQAKLYDTVDTAGTKSLYAMVDNLPYNTFIMSGFYRPLIGVASADHNALGQRMIANTILGGSSGRAQSLLFDATSIGAAPNVPFFIAHHIRGTKVIGGSIPGDNTQGYAFNGGLRFVTLGLAVNFTYWRTSNDNSETQEKTDIEISGLGLSGQFGILTAGIEVLSLARDQLETDFRRGGVATLDTQTKIWREYYGVAQYSYANRAPDLAPGKATQIKVGFRGFHLSGVESMLTYDIDEETNDGEKVGSTENTRKTSYITGQFHVFF